jgi:hypothetical protein
LIRARNIFELRQIVEECGGGNFVASVYLRSDGFLVQVNDGFLTRLARLGRLERFCEILKLNLTEAIEDAEKESKRSSYDGGTRADSLPGVQVGD